MVRKLIWLAVLFVQAPAHAQSVQIVQGDHTGSGSVVWRYPDHPDYGQVLTCWHVVNSNDPIGIIWKKDSSTQTSFASVLAVDKNADIALLDAYIGATPAIVVAPTTPPVGSKVVITGYGENIYNERPASIKAIEFDQIRLDHPSRRGDSGGAVTHNGRLIGISMALRLADYDGIAVPAEKIKHFLTDKAGWVFDPASSILPPQESPPPPRQPAPQPTQAAPSRKPSGGGVLFVRPPEPSPTPIHQNPAEQAAPQQTLPLNPPAALPAAGNQQVVGNQQPAIPQKPQGIRDLPAATNRRSAPSFMLLSVIVGSSVGVIAGTAWGVFKLVVRRKNRTDDEDADTDGEDRIKKRKPRKTPRDISLDSSTSPNGLPNDDGWFEVWFNRPADPADRDQRQSGTPRRKNRPGN
jgi:hypothetical protein